MSTYGWGMGWRVVGLATLCGALACGARAMVDPDGDDDQPLAEGGRGGTSSGGASGTGGAAGRRGGLPAGEGGSNAALAPPGGCESFRRSAARDRPCSYIYRGVCYEDDLCACSSACSSDAQCVIDGFLEADEPLRVRCISP